jgi:cation diffusion facilitator CzcD-associated flavoprotein CzcO
MTASALIQGRRLFVSAAAARPTTGAFATSFASILSKQSQGQIHLSTRSTFRRSSLLHTRRPLAFVSSARSMSTSTEETEVTTTPYDFDFFVIGGGSGGIASARRAASYGARVAVAESGRLGGTCVNVGCVPKKVMWNAASIAETVHDMNHYGFSSGDIVFDWNFLKQARDKYITRLNGIYERNLENSKVVNLAGMASLEGGNLVRVQLDSGDAVTYSAKHILIAVGGKPTFPSGEGIKEHSISSDGFFELKDLPRKAVVVGAGYIA